MENELIQTSQTTVGSSSAPTILDESIFCYPKNQHALSSNNTTSAYSFPLDSIIPVTPISNSLPLNQSVHHNMMTYHPLANNNSTQDSDDIFDVNMLHDRFFGISSVPTKEAPQKGYNLGNSGNSSSLMESLENSVSASSDKNNFNVCANTSGTYENSHQLRNHENNINNNVFSLQNEAMGGHDPLLGDYCNTSVNENFVNTNHEDSAMQNGDSLGIGHNSINPLVQLSGLGVGEDSDFPMLQYDFNIWRNWGN